MGRTYEKRQFMSMMIFAQLIGIDKIPATQRLSRDIVNKASELWDELEHQTKDDKEDE